MVVTITDPRTETPRTNRSPLSALPAAPAPRTLRRRFSVLGALGLATAGIVAQDAGILPPFTLDAQSHDRDNDGDPGTAANLKKPAQPTIAPEVLESFRMRREFKAEGKTPPPMDVTSAIVYANEQTGVDPDYLHRLAYAESTFRSWITNKDGGGKGACGLYQFRASSTYLEAIYRHGDKFPEEYRYLADTVEEYTIPARRRKPARTAFRIKDGVDQDMVYDACYDPKFASVLAAFHTLDLKDAIESRVDLDRPVNYAELYIGHFLGENGGPKLIAAFVDAKTRDTRVTKYVSAAQRKANDGIFKHVKTVDDFYEYFVEEKGMTDEPFTVGPIEVKMTPDLQAAHPVAHPVPNPYRHRPIPLPRPRPVDL